MSRILFWIIVIFAVLFALRMWNVAKARRRDKPRGSGDASAQAMVQCVRCGTFLPRPDAVTTPEGFRCTDPACTRHSSGTR